MSRIKKIKYKLFDKHFLIITLLTMGLVATVTAVSQKTQTQQQAAESINLNTANQIESTINMDGTMGPKTAKDNFSSTLPKTYFGELVLNITSSGHTTEISSLTLDISKVEVHLIHLFIPGTKNDNYAQNVNNQKTNQNISKWETLLPYQTNNQSSGLKLENGQSNTVSISELAGGKYSEIRLYISKANAKLADGKEVNLVIPGRANIIRVIKPFNVFSGSTTYLTLSINPQKSIILTGNTYFLEPVISEITINN